LFDGKIVSYQGADMTGKAHLKYKMSSNEINSYLYGYDDIQPNSDIVLVEGVFDAWRLHENTLATFGTHLTKKQLALLVSLKPKNIILCWDGDAYFKSRKIRIQLEERVEARVYCIPLPKNEDPDSYDRNKTLELIKNKLERS
jgi:DNA primase